MNNNRWAEVDNYRDAAESGWEPNRWFLYVVIRRTNDPKHYHMRVADL